jgi:hypothetical protein
VGALAHVVSCPAMEAYRDFVKTNVSYARLGERAGTGGE